jgi:phage terminase large subunit
VGVDFGFTNPTAVLEILLMRDGRFYVRSEWRKTGKTNSEVIEWAKTLSPNACYPDPAEPDRIEEMRRAGIPVRDVKKDVSWGIGRVREAIVANRLVVDPSCVGLLDEFATYRWREGQAGRNEPDEPEKHNDHCLDALRYAVAMSDAAPAAIADDLSLYESDWG